MAPLGGGKYRSLGSGGGNSPDDMARGLTRVSKATQDAVASLLAAGQAATNQAKATANARKQAEELTRQMTAMAARLQAGKLAVQRAGTALGYGATAGAGAVLAGARSGFRGTLEERRLNYQFERLNAGLANAMVPAMTKLTSWVEKLANGIGGLSRGQQSALMYGTAGVLGAAALHKGSTFLGGAGLGTMLGSAATAFGGRGGAATVLPVPGGGGGAAKPTALAKGAAPGRGRNWWASLGALFGPLAAGTAAYELGADPLTQALTGRKDARAVPHYEGPGGLLRYFSYGLDLNPKRQAEKEQRLKAKEQGEDQPTKRTLAGGGFEEAGSAYYRVADKYAQTGDTAAEKQLAAANKMQEAALAIAKAVGQMLGEERKQDMR